MLLLRVLSLRVSLTSHRGPGPAQPPCRLTTRPAAGLSRHSVSQHWTAVNRNPTLFPLHLSLSTSQPLLSCQPFPNSRHSKPRRVHQSSPSRTPAQSYKGSFCGCRHCQVHRMKRIVLLLRAASEAASARGKSRGKVWRLAAARIVRMTMVLSTGVLSQ